MFTKFLFLSVIEFTTILARFKSKKLRDICEIFLLLTKKDQFSINNDSIRDCVNKRKLYLHTYVN